MIRHMDIQFIFNERMRRFKLLLGRYSSQTQAARALGFPNSAPVSHYKTGAKNMGEEVAARLETAAGLPVGSLLSPLGIPWIDGTYMPRPDSRAASVSEDPGDYRPSAYRTPNGYSERHYIELSREWLMAQGIKASSVEVIHVLDDSQLPKIAKGDTVVVNSNWGNTPENNTLYAIDIGGSYTLRWAVYQTNSSLLLRCTNAAFPDEVVSACNIKNLSILGEFLVLQSCNVKL